VLAVTTDGSAYAWGRNDAGQLGIGRRDSSSLPTRVRHLSGVVMAAAGDTHSLFLTSAGEVFSAGLNQHGELGHGSPAV